MNVYRSIYLIIQGVLILMQCMSYAYSSDEPPSQDISQESMFVLLHTVVMSTCLAM